MSRVSRRIRRGAGALILAAITTLAVAVVGEVPAQAAVYGSALSYSYFMQTYGLRVTWNSLFNSYGCGKQYAANRPYLVFPLQCTNAAGFTAT